MYWDLPPLEKKKTNDNLVHKVEENAQGFAEDEEEGHEEVKPLMGSQELVGSYGSVVVTSNQCNNHDSLAFNASLNHSAPSPPSVIPQTHSYLRHFKNSSFSRGTWLMASVHLLFNCKHLIAGRNGFV